MGFLFACLHLCACCADMGRSGMHKRAVTVPQINQQHLKEGLGYCESNEEGRTPLGISQQTLARNDLQMAYSFFFQRNLKRELSEAFSFRKPPGDTCKPLFKRSQRDHVLLIPLHFLFKPSLSESLQETLAGQSFRDLKEILCCSDTCCTFRCFI